MKIATICGSVKIGRDYWDALAQNLNLRGWVVLTVNVWNLREFLHSPQGADVKLLLDKIHKEKISISDKIFVLRKEGYIGDSTRSEINYAESLSKPIEYIDIEDTSCCPVLLEPSDFPDSFQFALKEVSKK